MSRRLPVVMDIHWYHFTVWAAKWIPLVWYYRLIIPLRAWKLAWTARRQPVMIGEWSGVIAGEVLQRYDKRLHTAMEREHIQRQLRVYEQAAAWCYWTYKTEALGIWNYRSLVDDDPCAFELV